MDGATVMSDAPPVSAPASATKKRKAATTAEKTSVKKYRSDSDRLIALFVQGLPTPHVRLSASSGLIVGFNNQQLAQALYDELYGDAEEADDQESVERRLQTILDGGVELSLFKKQLYVVSDGPPPIPRPGESPADAASDDARVQKRPMKLFVVKDFPSRSLYPEVAVIIDINEASALSALQVLTAAAIDNRPNSIKKRGQSVKEVPLTAPGFYRLSEGNFYDYKRD